MFIEKVSRVSFLLFEHEINKIAAGDVTMANFVRISVAVRISIAVRIDRALLDGVSDRNTTEPSVGLVNHFFRYLGRNYRTETH